MENNTKQPSSTRTRRNSITTSLLQSKKPLNIKLLETKSWVINVSGLFLGADEKDLQTILNDGIVLCTIFHKLHPEVFPLKKINKKFVGVSSQWKKRENIELFLTVAREKLNMKESSLFKVTDVYEWKDPKKVVDSLFNFYLACKKAGLINQELKVWPGQPIPKLNMKETKRIGVEYVALYDSIPTTKDEIAMLKGDNILVYTIYRDGWCRCLLNGREEGVAPLNYLQKVDKEEEDESASKKTVEVSGITNTTKAITMTINTNDVLLDIPIISSPPTTKNNKKPVRHLEMENILSSIPLKKEEMLKKKAINPPVVPAKQKEKLKASNPAIISTTTEKISEEDNKTNATTHEKILSTTLQTPPPIHAVKLQINKEKKAPSIIATTTTATATTLSLSSSSINTIKTATATKVPLPSLHTNKHDSKTTKKSLKKKKSSNKLLKMSKHLPVTTSLELADKYYGAYNKETKKWIAARYKLHEADVLIESKEKSRNFLNEDEKRQLKKAEKLSRRYMAALANHISKSKGAWPNRNSSSTVITGAGIPSPVLHCLGCNKLIPVYNIQGHVCKIV